MNLKGIEFLIADNDVNFRVLLAGILRSFGATRIHEAHDVASVQARLSAGTIDFLLCDSHLDGGEGFGLVRSIRRDHEHPAQLLPILVLSSHTQKHNVERARDCGANFVVAKPIPPATLYARLEWVAQDRRQFILCDTYVGPERRHRVEGYAGGVGGRRAEDKARRAEEKARQAALEEKGTLDQSDIDQMFE